MREKPRPMQRYQHFKGGLYQVLALARDAETMQEAVVYQALYGDYVIYVRPLAMFMSEVDKAKYPDAGQRFRFEEVQAGAPVSVGDAVPKPITPLTPEVKPVTPLTPEVKPVTPLTPEVKPVTPLTSEVKPVTPEVKPAASPTPEPETELQLDSAVLEFLDADSYGKKLNILASLRHRITDDMITTMAIASDLEVDEGPVEQRYEQLKNCLLMKEKYECVRIR